MGYEGPIGVHKVHFKRFTRPTGLILTFPTAGGGIPGLAGPPRIPPLVPHREELVLCPPDARVEEVPCGRRTIRPNS